MNSPDAHEQFGIAFKRAMAAVRRLRGRETHHPGELSYAQYSVLFSLAEGIARSARDLADLADLSPASVTQMLDGLARAGLVERVRSEDDKRVVLSSLTDHGQEVIAARRATVEGQWLAALRDFSDADLLTAAAILDRIRELFDAMDARPAEAPTEAAASGAAA